MFTKYSIHISKTVSTQIIIIMVITTITIIIIIIIIMIIAIIIIINNNNDDYSNTVTAKYYPITYIKQAVIQTNRPLQNIILFNIIQ